MSNLARFVNIGVLVALVWVPVNASEDYVATNLEVIPAGTDLKIIHKVMNAFTQGLGVNCSHCHVKDPSNPRKMAYALDEKETKKVARAMMRMTLAINTELLTKTGRTDLLDVTCETCHRGHTRPQTLMQVLEETMAAGGEDSTLTRYRQLRKKYYGRAGYDFGEKALWPISHHFEELGEAGLAEALLKVNLEHFPESFGTHLNLGFLLERGGDRESALQSFEKALEIMPRAKFVAKQIEKLRSQE